MNINIGGKIKSMLKSWLDIQDAQSRQIVITEVYNFETNCIKNKLWYRGDPHELSTFYKSIAEERDTFWAAVPRIRIRKIHSGLPGIIVDTLTGILIRDMNEIDAGTRKQNWEEIAKDNKFVDVVKDAINKVLYIGDGAFKISFDTSISKYPLIEFVSGENIEYVYKRGRYVETQFRTVYNYNQKKYILVEMYGYGYIKNKLIEASSDKEVPLETVPELSILKDVAFSGYKESKDGKVLERGTVNLAVPLKFYNSPKFPNRGKSIFDSKAHDFDAFDEVISQWADAVRGGRAKHYIPESLLPRNPDTGKTIAANPFDDRFIAAEGTMAEDGKNKMETVQPSIPVDSYKESYISFLDLCLQGIISPSTLGIDTKKLDNAEAQREKEKMTLYTRGTAIEALQKGLPKVVNVALQASDIFNSKTPGEEIEIDVPFGEYANPSHEAVIETVAKGKQGGIMSLEASVEELYGDTKDEDWKAGEVKRLKEEQGITQLKEPGMNEPDIVVEEEVEDDITS